MLQLAVFFLLQASLLLPPVAQALNNRTAVAVCHGDHAECGCAPARIAAGTCCCAIKSLPPCCKKKAEEKEAAIKVKLTTPPCGGNDPLTVAAAETFMPVFHAVPRLFPLDWNYAPAPPRQQPKRCLQPPVPPPQHLV